MWETSWDTESVDCPMRKVSRLASIADASISPRPRVASDGEGSIPRRTVHGGGPEAICMTTPEHPQPNALPKATILCWDVTIAIRCECGAVLLLRSALESCPSCELTHQFATFVGRHSETLLLAELGVRLVSFRRPAPHVNIADGTIDLGGL